MLNKLVKDNFTFAIIGAILIRLIFAFLVHHPDVNNHVDWGIRFFEYGASKFYHPSSNVWSYTWPNQPPGTIYIFAVVKVISDIVFAFFWLVNVTISLFPSKIMFFLEGNLHFVMAKLPGIICDFGVAAVIYRVARDILKSRLARFYSLGYLFNPVVWYNSSVWGQYDSVVILLALVSIYFLLKKSIYLSIIFLALSFYVKITLVIFIPIYIIALYKLGIKVPSLVKAILLAGILISTITVPFSDGFPILWLYKLYTQKVLVNQLQVITANAFNLWAFIAGIHEQPHDMLAGFLSYKVWGGIFFAVNLSVIAYQFYKSFTPKNFFWSLSLVSLSSFVFLTNMHERYLYPFFVFFMPVGGRLLSYWILAIINLLNLYNFWWFPRLGFLVSFLSFGDRVMPRILGLGVTFLYFYLLGIFIRRKGVVKI
jgi:Gpi18-like mannosyltransferase